MIALDNGPADGDYVRYIEQLIAATRTTATGTTSAAALSGPTFVPMANLSTLPGQPSASRSTTRTTPAAAAAIAQAMTIRTPTPKPALDNTVTRGLAGVLVGLALIAFGFFSEPIHAFLVVIGFLSLAAGARALTRLAGARVTTA